MEGGRGAFGRGARGAFGRGAREYLVGGYFEGRHNLEGGHNLERGHNLEGGQGGIWQRGYLGGGARGAFGRGAHYCW